jgi:hypothetical protein
MKLFVAPRGKGSFVARAPSVFGEFVQGVGTGAIRCDASPIGEVQTSEL